jgi:hypothetical protein
MNEQRNPRKRRGTRTEVQPSRKLHLHQSECRTCKQSRPISTLSQVGLQLPHKEERTNAQLMQMISMPRLRHALKCLSCSAAKYSDLGDMTGWNKFSVLRKLRYMHMTSQVANVLVSS